MPRQRVSLYLDQLWMHLARQAKGHVPFKKVKAPMSEVVMAIKQT